MERVIERVTVARRALATLEELAYKESASVVERDAAIQRFEYTFETVWKSAQAYLREAEGIELASPKGVVRSAWQVGLLSEEDGRLALDMVNDRNLTSHAYNERVASAIHARLGAYAALMDRWLTAISTRTAAIKL